MTEQSTILEQAPDLPLPPVPPEPMGEFAAFVTAVQFLTRVPLSTRTPVSAAVLSRCPVYFPIVGGMIGLVTAVVLGIGSLVWPIWLAVIVALAVEARLTGAFHEDSVADFCDAFGGGWTRDDVLRILKDSRIGSFGAMGLGLAVALRAGAIIEVVQQSGRHHWLVWSSAIVASSAIGRLVMVVVMFWVPPVPARESLSRDVGRQMSGSSVFVAFLWTVFAALPFVILRPVPAVIAIVALVPMVAWFRRLVLRRLGGITGDCLGCICYGAMIVVLLSTAARWSP